MNSVASDALEIQRRNLLSVANSELQRHQQQNQEHLQEYQQDVQRHLSEVQNEVQSQQVARRAHYRTLYTAGRSWASESSSEITSRDMSVIHRLLIAAAWKRKQKDVKMQCSRKKEERRNGGGRDGGMKKRRRDMEKESEQEEAKREGKEEP